MTDPNTLISGSPELPVLGRSTSMDPGKNCRLGAEEPVNSRLLRSKLLSRFDYR